MKYYLAVDIGASSGRHVLAHVEDKKIVIEEIHRFENGMQMRNGHLVWDTEKLFVEILTGMQKCKARGKIPHSMGIDTWAVDYALLNQQGERIGEVYGYRDSRTEGMDSVVYRAISEEQLYERTGIQKQSFNTIYQLMADKQENPGDRRSRLEEAACMLLIPDYFHYLLTGKKVTEYTNATTTQLVNPISKDWDDALIARLGYPREIFAEIKLPGSDLGELTAEIQEKVGFNCHVVLPATHDTGSAVMAVPGKKEHLLYISSGTWSLMGTELAEADCSRESRECNLTNEGGYDYRFRYLKNIMGLWMINSVKKEIADQMSFTEICKLASEAKIASIVPANHTRFLAPQNMTAEVKAACKESGQQIPETVGEIAAVIYNSLAKCYAETIAEIEKQTGETYDCIHIVGGGAKADYLNRLTAKYCEKTVYAGPVEATAIGNAAAQMIAAGEFTGLKEARERIFDSFEIVTYQ